MCSLKFFAQKVNFQIFQLPHALFPSTQIRTHSFIDLGENIFMNQLYNITSHLSFL